MAEVVKIGLGDVYYDDGTLIVDARHISVDGKHYDIEYYIEDGLIHVKGRKPEWICNFSAGTYPYELVREKYVEEYKPYFWSKKKKKRSKAGWCELTVSNNVKYTSNSYLIIS